jgi:hypothetical protein
MAPIEAVLRRGTTELASSVHDGTTWSVLRTEDGGFALLEVSGDSTGVEYCPTARRLLETLFRKVDSSSFAELAWALLGKVF